MYGNPLFERLTRGAKWPSLRVTAWIAAGLAAVGLAGCAAGLGTLPAFQVRAEYIQTTQESSQAMHGSGQWVNIAMLIFLPLVLIGPPVAAGVTATQTSRDVRSEAYTLMRLTPMTKNQIVQGYLLAGLHRVRLLLALVVGLTPAWIGAVLNNDLRISILPWYDFSIPAAPERYQIYHIVPLDVIGGLLRLTALAAGILALFLLAAAIGTALALWWRKVPAGAAIIAPLAALLGVLFGFLVALPIFGPLGMGSFSQGVGRDWGSWQLLGLTAGLCIPPPALLAWGAIALARRVV